ncbi:MAG: hypothetical protein C0516_11145 [Gemmatimonas sp.]|nr:hypothetical protein [Gemmatimonas sp.]
MLRSALRAFLAATSLSPVLLTWAYVRYSSSAPIVECALLVFAALALLVACRWVIVACQKHLPDLTPFHAKAVKASDNDLVTFVLAYMFPLIGLTETKIDVLAIGFAILLLFLIVMSTHAYQTNPLLALFGYHFYEVEASNGVTYFMLSKQEIRATTDVKQVKLLSPFVVLDSTR